MNRTILVALAFPALAACLYTTTTTVLDACRLEASIETTGVVQPGDSVAIAAHPLTADFDTLVLVDGIEADAFVDRADCSVCDACIADAGCDPCGDCEECEISCSTCVEHVTFVVPDVAGTVPVALINSYGSADMELSVLGDTGVEDTDTGVEDTDTGVEDTDTGVGDTAAGDTADSDTAALDTDPADTDTATP